MWLMSIYGFYSIVNKDGKYHIRSRERVDLENICKNIEGLDIEVGNCTDYKYRIVVGKEDYFNIVGFICSTVSYPNFKDEIETHEDQENKPYHEVYNLLASTLGSYE